MDTKLKPVLVHLEPEDQEQLKEIKRTTGVTVAWQIRLAIREYLQRPKIAK